MNDIKIRYSDDDLNEFKLLINEKIKTAEEDLAVLRENFMNDGNNGTDDTSPSF